jgi:hypothetical protein
MLAVQDVLDGAKAFGRQLFAVPNGDEEWQGRESVGWPSIYPSYTGPVAWAGPAAPGTRARAAGSLDSSWRPISVSCLLKDRAHQCA